jgi:carboxylesterase
MSIILPKGDAFLHPGGPVGCLLIHGFTGAPNEMRWFGGQLAKKGYSVVGIRLFGHATHMEDMIRARPQDWVASVEDGYHLLRGLCDHVVVMGLSLGGILTLHFASRHAVRGAVAMSTPFVVEAPWLQRVRPLLPALSMVVPYMNKGTPDWRDPEAHRTHVEYPRHPVRAVAPLLDIHREMLAGLPSIACPTLLIASHGDKTVPPWHSQAIFDRLTTTDKQLVLVENSGHVVTRDLERQRVADSAAAFVRRVTGWPTSHPTRRRRR